MIQCKYIILLIKIVDCLKGNKYLLYQLSILKALCILVSLVSALSHLTQNRKLLVIEESLCTYFIERSTKNK